MRNPRGSAKDDSNQSNRRALSKSWAKNPGRCHSATGAHLKQANHAHFSPTLLNETTAAEKWAHQDEILTCRSPPDDRESWIIKIQMNLNRGRMQSCGAGSKLKGFGRELNKVYLGCCSLSCLVVCEGSGATEICRKWESGHPTTPPPLLSAPQPNTLVQLLSTSRIGRRPWDTAAVCPQDGGDITSNRWHRRVPHLYIQTRGAVQ